MLALRRSLVQAWRFRDAQRKIKHLSRSSPISSSKGTVSYRCVSNESDSSSHNATIPPSIPKFYTINSVYVRNRNADKKASLVIFDKDGTMVCCQSMWFPWTVDVAKIVEIETGLKIRTKVFDTLGVCSITNRVLPGVLSEGTDAMVRTDLVNMLMEEGVEEASARKIVQRIYEKSIKQKDLPIKTFTNLKTLFKILKNYGVKVAVCTSDSREGTEATLRSLGVTELVDQLVCGSDPDSKPKPSPHNAYMICEKLGVDPANTVMVGDTKSDVGMAKAAKLGWNIGVLSGVSQTSDLHPDAHHVIESVNDLLPLILPPEQWRPCYQYSSEERILVEPPSWEHSDEVSELKLKSDVGLVIFDLHGTILCTHRKYAKWLNEICSRLEQITGLHLREIIYNTLGMNQTSGKLQQGLLNDYGPNIEVKKALVDLVRREGLIYEEAMLTINTVLQECNHILTEQPKALHHDTHQFFKTLNKYGIQIAIRTSDIRESTLSDLKSIGVLHFIDMMVCGNDPHQLSNTQSNTVELICDELGVDKAYTVIVGDSPQDFNIGNISKKIGVLTGVGSTEDLLKVTDHVVPNVVHVLPHLINDKSMERKRKPPSNANSGRSQMLCQDVKSSTSTRNFSTSSIVLRDNSSEWSSSGDYVIVGAGSAGSALTNRLSHIPDNKVVVLEAGPKDYLWNWKIHMPAALMYNLCDDKYNWYYHTEPEKHMNNRVMYWPRGRVWGGSSSLNAMVYVRGNALDYDGWEAAGADGWSYADCLPYFKKAQTHELGADDYRGGDGPLHVSRGKTNHILHQKFINAGIEAGVPYTEDMNGYQQEGVGWFDMSIHKGKRWSSSRAYLRPAELRPNVKIISKALATRILFEGNKAVGVEYEKDGKLHQVRANKEVILSGGAVNSPQLLMLSGIGNADELKKLGIEMTAHLPGVGENLQDHLEIVVQQECTQPITLYKAQWKFPHNMIRIGMQWFLSQTGDGATTHFESGGFVRGDGSVDCPNIQFHFVPGAVSDHGRIPADRHAFQLHSGIQRPQSRGFLKLKTKNPREHPRIIANYLSTEQDIKEMRQSVHWAREIFRQKSFDDVRGPEIAPGIDIQSDAQIDEFCRATGDTLYHPSSTCKMGSTKEPMTVVDSQARVLGVDGLRVVDASIMPNTVTGNLNGPTIMLAEKIADLVLGKTPLPKSNVAVYKHKL